MSNSEISLVLRRRALEAVSESTEMLKQALALLRMGDRQRAEELQKAARAKRHSSVWLMQKANNLDRDS